MILLVSVIVCGAGAFVVGGVGYVVVFILGICMLLVKDFIFWRGSAEKLSFKAYILGDVPEPSTLGHDKSEGRSHHANPTVGLFARLRKRRKGT